MMVNFLGFGFPSPLFFILNNIADVWVLYTEKWETHYYEGRKGVAAVYKGAKRGRFLMRVEAERRGQAGYPRMWVGYCVPLQSP